MPRSQKNHIGCSSFFITMLMLALLILVLSHRATLAARPQPSDRAQYGRGEATGSAPLRGEPPAAAPLSWIGQRTDASQREAFKSKNNSKELPIMPDSVPQRKLKQHTPTCKSRCVRTCLNAPSVTATDRNLNCGVNANFDTGGGR